MDSFTRETRSGSLGDVRRASQRACPGVGVSASEEDRPGASPCPQKDATTALERRLLRRLLRAVGNPAASVILWDGEEVCEAPSRAVTHILIRDRRTLWRLLSDPAFQFGETYSSGRLEVEGDMLAFLRSANEALNKSEAAAYRAPWPWRWLRRPGRNTLRGSRDNIHRHYDIGNEFYKLWLDEQLVYTCAYFADRSMTLEQAQIAKMDHVCRKLRLQPGETVIEAGCGWGALALHMARHWGVNVKAYNISHEQVVHARRRAQVEDLDHRVEFIEDDWRNITGPCDAFVSVGMLEHVGPANYRRLGDVIQACLQADGRGLIHSIGVNRPRPFDAWIERRIFPGAQPPALSQMTAIFESNDFTILDVENLRLHYAETLKHWLSRYERSVDAVREMFDERFTRMWRLYLTASIAAFESGGLQLFQVLFAPGTNHAVPWTRRYQYSATGAAAEATVRPAAVGEG